MPPKKDANKAKFIEAVGENSFLYDKREDEYKNKTKVDEKWAELATDYGYEGKFKFIVYLIFIVLDGKEAKSTWDNVVKAYNESKKPAKSGSKPKKNYIFATELTFLDGIKESDK